MKGKSILALAGGLVLLVSGPAFGVYTSIQHNLIDQYGDTSFDPGSGALTVSADNNNNLTLNDPGPLGGNVTNGHVDMVTYLTGYDPIEQVASFSGGSYNLTFKYDGIDRQIGGPIHGMAFEIDVQSSMLSYLYGQGVWTASTKNLPGSGYWPDDADPVNNPNGLSSMTSLTLAIGFDMSWFQWNTPVAGNVQTLYNLWPDNRAVPEPTSVLLLALGSLGLLRRRRA